MNEAAWEGLGRIGQVAIGVRDLDRAVAFYRDTLGMRFLFRVPRMAFFDCGGLRLMLALPEGEERQAPASILYFAVADIMRAASEIAGRGAFVRAEPQLVARMPDHELWMAFFLDSEGNTFALMSEVR